MIILIIFTEDRFIFIKTSSFFFFGVCIKHAGNNQPAHSLVSGNWPDICHIPNRYYTQKMIDEYYNKTKDIESIPKKFKTKKMCDDYFENTKNINIKLIFN